MDNYLFEHEGTLLDLRRILMIRGADVFLESVSFPVSLPPESLDALKTAFKQRLSGVSESLRSTSSAAPAPMQAFNHNSPLPLKALFLVFDSRQAYRLSFLMLVSSKLVNGNLRSAARFFYPQHHAPGFEPIKGDGHWRQAFEDKGLFQHAVQLRLPTKIVLEGTFRAGFNEDVWRDLQLQINELLEGGNGEKWDWPMATPDNYRRRT